MNARYLVERRSGFYFQPTAKMKAAGFRPEPLGRDPVAAFARIALLTGEWDTIRKGAKATADTSIRGTLKWLIREYQASTWYTELSVGTKDQVDRHLAYIEASPLADAHVGRIQRPDCREFYDKCAAARGIWKANDVHKYLCRVLSYGVERGVIQTNPAARMGIKDPKPRQVTWTPDQVQVFIDKATEIGFTGWAIAVSIGYDSAQDLMVILARQWHHFDGEGIDFRRTKTGIASWSPCSARTLGLLAGPRTAIYICTTPLGRPINSRSYFGRVFRQIRKDAGLPAIRFRDLRRTVGTEVFRGGGKLEPLLGLTPGSPVQKHYVVPDREAARKAQASRRPERREP